MTLLGEGWDLTSPEPADDSAQDDLLALRLEMVLTALDGLAQALRELPTPQVFIDAPDLSAIVQAVNGLKPGADPDEIAQAVIRQIAPTAQKPEPDTIYPELVKALEKLDFRLRGIGGHNGSAGNIIDLKDNTDRILGHVTVDNFPASGGGVASSVTVSNFPATQAVSAATLPLPAGAATETTLGLVAKDATFTKDADGGIKTHVQNFPASQTVSGSVSVANFPATQPVSLATAPTTPVTGTFWQATQPVSLATNTPDVTDRSARLLGHVTIDNASLTVSNGQTQPLTDTQLRASAVPVSGTVTATLGAGSATVGAVKVTDGTNTAALNSNGSLNVQGYLFNGSTWDVQRGLGVSQTTGDTGAKTTAGAGALQSNPGNKGVQVLITLGTVSGVSPTCTFKLQGSVDGGTTFYDIPGAATAALTASVNVGICVYPGVATVAGTTTTQTTATASQTVPRNWRVAWTVGGTTPSFTITAITYNYLSN